MKTTLLATLVFSLLAVTAACAEIITLSAPNSGNYWYAKSSWMGGSNTSSGFSYADENGLIHAQRNYEYYGGADRSWEQKDIYFQIDLSSLAGEEVESATFNFYVAALNSDVATPLKHLSDQTTSPTGDAGQKLAGNTDVASSSSFVLGWNSIDLTSYILSDLDKGYSYTVLSIPQFSQEQDVNRVLSIYSASAADVDDSSVKPYLSVGVPEPGRYSLLVGGLLGVWAFLRRRAGKPRSSFVGCPREYF